ncbi:MAG: hypothetical protein Q7R86_02775 [bacterium]|nr:hypothetical protein [bacterium]
MQQENKICQNCHNQFTIEPDDLGFYETIKVPPPTWCPKCRTIRRMAWAGYRFLYKRKCDFTGETVITTTHPNAPFKVYKQDVWWSDKWDPKSYGRDYDFSKPFFEQFSQLFKEVPMPALYTEYSTMINSDYCNAAAELKNCYLCFKADYSEDSAYLNTISYIKDSFDLAFSNNSELSYESVNINKCYQTFYSKDCSDCHDIYFSENLIGCSSCIGCINLRNKNYHIFNQPHSKDEYEKILESLDLDSYRKREEFKKQAIKEGLKFPRKEYHGWKNTNISGDYIMNSKNVHETFMAGNCENIKYGQLLKAGPARNCYDYTMFALNAEWIYESCWVGLQVNNVKFSDWCYKDHDIEYCFGCHGSGNLFGCSGVRNSEYCILNKQYTKNDYQELVKKIKEQMDRLPYKDEKGRVYKYGEYFPPEFAPWPYNETTGYEWFKLTKEEAEDQGYWWQDPDKREFKPATMKVPDHINDVKDEILKAILRCDTCGRNYQIIKKELVFYRRFQIPVPHECPLCRDFRRISSLNPMALYNRKCAKCSRKIKTSYAPNRPEIVYCESCYQAEVV